jgi:hypothetical protein
VGYIGRTAGGILRETQETGAESVGYIGGWEVAEEKTEEDVDVT